MATRARSPNYPALSLPKALELARRVYDKNHLHPASPPVVAAAMGYTSLNGNSATAISGLKKFGLLEDDGKGLKITQDALTVLVEPAGSVERAKLIVQLSTKPSLFQSLQELYPGTTPNDDILRSYLLKNGFVQQTVDVPIRSYRETMELVDRERSVYSNHQGRELMGAPEHSVSQPDNPAHRQGLEVPVQPRSPSPLTMAISHRGVNMRQEVFALEEGDVTIQWPESISEESFEDFNDWMVILLRKVKRGIRAPNHDAEPKKPGNEDFSGLA